MLSQTNKKSKYVRSFIYLVNQGKSALEKDANKLSNSIQSDVANLLNSKK